MTLAGGFTPPDNRRSFQLFSAAGQKWLPWFQQTKVSKCWRWILFSTRTLIRKEKGWGRLSNYWNLYLISLVPPVTLPAARTVFQVSQLSLWQSLPPPIIMYYWLICAISTCHHTIISWALTLLYLKMAIQNKVVFLYSIHVNTVQCECVSVFCFG